MIEGGWKLHHLIKGWQVSKELNLSRKLNAIVLPKSEIFEKWSLNSGADITGTRLTISRGMQHHVAGHLRRKPDRK